MNYHLTEASSNVKTGKMAVSTTSAESCPESCPWSKGLGCYASYGNLRRHWDKVTKGERGDNWESFLLKLQLLPKGTAFRHNQAGDLPGEGEEIDNEKLQQLSDVVKKRNLKAFTYSHKNVGSEENLPKIRAAISKGLVINASCESFEEVDRLRALGLPVVVVVPENSPEKQFTKAGNKVIICPQQLGKTLSCASCLLCFRGSRSIVVGFKPHGKLKKAVNKRLEENLNKQNNE
jgi:hypothetical protein